MCISNTLKVVCAEGFGILINAIGAEIWPKMYLAISSYGEIF